MLKYLRNFFRDVFSEEPLKKQTSILSRLGDAEDIITAAFCSEIAKKFPDGVSLTTDKNSITKYVLDIKGFKELSFRNFFRNDTSCDFWEDSSFFWVEGVPLSHKNGMRIIKTFCDLRQRKEEIEVAAAKALREQQANEKKWNLAEDILGMRRLSDGTLVPKKKLCCDCDKEFETGDNNKLLCPDCM